MCLRVISIVSKVQVYGASPSVFLCPTYGRSCDTPTKAVLGPPVESL